MAQAHVEPVLELRSTLKSRTDSPTIPHGGKKAASKSNSTSTTNTLTHQPNTPLLWNCPRPLLDLLRLWVEFSTRTVHKTTTSTNVLLAHGNTSTATKPFFFTHAHLSETSFTSYSARQFYRLFGDRHPEHRPSHNNDV